MRADRPSSTAELVCSWRALGTLFPAERRILDDPYARGFLALRRRMAHAAAERMPGWMVERMFYQADRAIGGSMGFILARHRAIDDLLTERRELDQVVILGTGYDTRRVRLAPVLEGRTLFEVDHPATLGRRRTLATDVFGDRPKARTVEVAVDFGHESFADRLIEAGFEPGGATLWIWEGVSMYLEEVAVRQTLDAIRRLSAPGSLVTFDTWCAPSGGLPRLVSFDLPSRAMALFYSEPLRFAPRPKDLPGLLADHGMVLHESVPAHELTARYRGEQKGGRRFSLMFLNLAEVAEPSEVEIAEVEIAEVATEAGPG